MSARRILHVIASTRPEGGGPIEGVLRRAEVLIGQGHELEVASLDAPNSDWLDRGPIPMHGIGDGHGGYGRAHGVVEWIREHAPKFDAVVVNGIWQYHSFAAWEALHGAKTPYVVFPHGMLDPYFNRAFPLKALKKRMYWRWGEYRVLRDAARVLFTCEEEMVLARESFRPYKVRERVVKYGTSTPPTDEDSSMKAAFLAKHPELEGKHALLFLSRIHPKKGCDLLVRAFAEHAVQHPDVVLVMAGPDQVGVRAELEALACDLGLHERVVWTGMLQGEMKWGAYRTADAFVLPSHQENFGIVVAEALACGLPTLISNKVNIWREIERYGAGFVQEDTVEGTSELLRRWFETPTDARERMRRDAVRCFEENFTVQGSAESLIQAVEDVLKGER